MSVQRTNVSVSSEKIQYAVPVFVLVTIVLSAIFHYGFQLVYFSITVSVIGIVVGSWQLLKDTLDSIRKRSFALDYIAILAIITGLITANFLVSGVIVLMMSGGNALEAYAQKRAKKSLTALKNRIPNRIQVIDATGQLHTQQIEKVEIGSHIFLRKGEVVPLDGVLVEQGGTFDESSLTGEPYPIKKQNGDPVRSGTVNIGEAVTIRTVVVNKDSTYHHIVQLVNEAESAKAPFIQLADRLSAVFTLLTLILAAIAYLISGDLTRVLSVLVIATPCPLILATPIALIGGMNAAAQERIIFKQLAALEALAETTAIIFDKTGTITLGQPKLETVTSLSQSIHEEKIISIAAGLEKNSLHPFAKAIMAEAKKRAISPAHLENTHEKIGEGIMGKLQKDWFRLSGDKKHGSSEIVLYKNDSPVARLTFNDELKSDSIKVLEKLQSLHIDISVFTGDSQKRAQEVLKKLPAGIHLQSQLSPQEKQKGIKEIKSSGKKVAMVGDGINDAPALALADVGLVFSHEEHTAASEAADIVLLAGDFKGVLKVLEISRRTMHIAQQSMYVGLGLSLLGMIYAALGHLPPFFGAVSQELIDVAVILNALRAARSR